MKYFLSFMVWATDLELTLARQYGNKDLVLQLTQDLNKWVKAAQDHDINRRFA